MSNLATIVNNILADSGIDDINVVVTTGSYSNPAWITSLAWTKITGAPANIITGTGTANYVPKFTGTGTIGNSLIYDDGTYVGINTTAPNRNLTVVGTTRHERVYAYGNYSFNFVNSAGVIYTWFKLGDATPFSQTRIYYRAGTSTSEEEGEIKVSNTCAQPFIEWTRNTYSYHIQEVKARMVSGCGACEIWVLVRHGNYNLGANTNFQWQIHDGTDSSFVVANTTGTPGTGTNEKSINSSDLYFYANSDNMSIAGLIGVGTTSPTQKLHVAGNVRVTGAYYDSNNSAGTSGQVLSSTGTGTDWVSLSEITGVDGTGTANYIAKWQDANTIQNSIIYDNGTNVGIGTAGPSYKLDIQAAAGVAIRVRNTFNTDDAYLLAQSTLGSALFGINAVGQYLYTGDAIPLLFYNSATERMRITATGNVGIGTSSPGDALVVYRSSGDSSGFFKSANGGAELSLDSTNGYASLKIYASSVEKWRVGQINDSIGFSIWQSGGGHRLYVTSTGNVGIGTTAPAVKLQVDNNTHNYIQLNSTVANVQTAISAQNTSSNNRATLAWEDGTRGAYADLYSSTYLTITTQSSEKMRITASGLVGIGTSSPSYRLHVKSAGLNSVPFAIQRNANTNNIFYVYEDASGNGTATVENSTGTTGVFLNSSGSSYFNGGNVGIGTTTPYSGTNVTSLDINASAYPTLALSVAGTFVGGLLGFTNRITLYAPLSRYLAFDTNDTERMRITVAGNVGIGTTVPLTKLHVVGSITAEYSDSIYLDYSPSAGDYKKGFSGLNQSTSTARGLHIFNYDNDSNQGINFWVGTNAARLQAAVIKNNRQILLNAYGSGSYTGTVAYNLAVDSSGNIIETAGGVVDGSGTANYVPRWQDANTLTNSIIYDNGTNVGVNTSAPVANLHVTGVCGIPSSGSLSIAAPASGGGCPSYFIMGNNDSAGVAGPNVIMSANRELLFGLGNSFSSATGGTFSELMRVSSNGNVGIGTSSPGYKLDVQGNAGIVTLNTNGSLSAGGQFISGLGEFVSAVCAVEFTITK